MAAKDAFLDTRVSLLARQLLRRPEREALLWASEEELRPLLQQTGLHHLVSEPPGDTRILEQQLATVLVNESLLLMHGMNSDQRRFIRYWLRRLELINLKIILRSKLSGFSTKEILENLLDLGPLTTLPIDALVGTESAEELLRRLESTPYAAMARQARKVYEEHLDLFNAEATLDTHYYHQLVQQARALKSACGEQVRALLGSWLDQINLPTSCWHRGDTTCHSRYCSSWHSTTAWSRCWRCCPPPCGNSSERSAISGAWNTA